MSKEFKEPGGDGIRWAGGGELRLEMEVEVEDEDVCLDCLTLRKEKEKSQGNVKSSLSLAPKANHKCGRGRVPLSAGGHGKSGANGVLPLTWELGH